VRRGQNMSFIRRASQRTVEDKAAVKGGPGHAENTLILNSDAELYGKGRLFNDIVLEKDCGVGYHLHQGDGETYYMISGEAEYNDNGVVTTIRAGDVTFTGDGEGHAITNHRDEPARFIALILYK
jgi:quercetin dioxygenase-like cupin family protein